MSRTLSRTPSLAEGRHDSTACEKGRQRRQRMALTVDGKRERRKGPRCRYRCDHVAIDAAVMHNYRECSKLKNDVIGT